MTLEDPDLSFVTALKAGQDQALNALMDLHRKGVFNFVFRHIPNEADAVRFLPGVCPIRTLPTLEEYTRDPTSPRLRWAREGITAGKMLSRPAHKALQPSTSTENLERRNGVPIIPAHGEIITSEHVRRLVDEEGI